MGSHGDAEDTRLLLWQAQYAEACRYHRHWDTLKWTVIGLAYPSAAALIAFAVSNWDWASHSTRVTFVVWVAVLWVFVSGAVFRQLHYYTSVYRDRARKLESGDDLDDYDWQLHRCFPSGGLPWWKAISTWAVAKEPRKLSWVFGWLIPCLALLGAIVVTWYCITGNPLPGLDARPGSFSIGHY